MSNMKIVQIFIVVIFVSGVFGRRDDPGETPEEREGVKYANNCEACKYLAVELQARMQETGKTSEVLDFGYSVDDVKPKKRKEYKRSEVRFIESLENVCERILEYNIHKERKDSTRFAKGMSQTFQTLHGLVDKGVKVELGIPYELWDKPSAEVTQLKTQCETLLEQYENVIEDWYFKHQDEENNPLIKYLCEDHVLTKEDAKCLNEVLRPKGDSGSGDDDDKKKSTDAEDGEEEENPDSSTKKEEL